MYYLKINVSSFLVTSQNQIQSSFINDIQDFVNKGYIC